MRSWVFVAGVLIASSSFAGCAFAQAAAEAVITHGVTSAAGTSMGTSIGRAANQLGAKIGQQTSNAIARPAVPALGTRPRGAVKVPPVPVPAGPSHGSIVASIQGAAQEESTCREGSSVAAAPEQVVQANASPSQSPRSKCKAQGAPSSDAHPSVINLAPAK